MCVCTTRGRVSIVLSGCGSASDAMSPTPPETVLLLGVLSGKQDSHLTFSGSEAPIVNRVLHWWWCFFCYIHCICPVWSIWSSYHPFCLVGFSCELVVQVAPSAFISEEGGRWPLFIRCVEKSCRSWNLFRDTTTHARVSELQCSRRSLPNGHGDRPRGGVQTLVQHEVQMRLFLNRVPSCNFSVDAKVFSW